MRTPRRFPTAALASLLLAPSAGAQWQPVASPTTRELRGLSVVSPAVAWASGVGGTVLRTTDGGRTWSADTVPGASKLDLRAIDALSATTAHAMSIGDSSRIFRTTDGGRTWTLRYTATEKGSFLDAIRFWDARHGIAMSDPVDGRFMLVTTNDGGETWTRLAAERVPPAIMGEGGFAASGSCLAVWGTSHVWFVSGGGAAARVYHSADRGRTWSVHDTPLRAGAASAGAFSVAFRDARHGVISGGDYAQPALRGRNVALTSDGGRTWTLVDSASSPAGYRSAVAFVPGTAGRSLVAVGLTGTDVSRDGGRTWTPVDSVPYNSVVMTRRGGIAVGPRGQIGTAVPRTR